MNIAYITQSYPPMVSGAARVVERLARGMVGLSHNVLVISASNEKYAYTEQSNGITIYRVQSLNNPLRVDQKFTLWKFKEIKETLQEFRAEIVHAHDTLIMGVTGLFAAKKLGCPIAVTVHQLPWFVSTYISRFPRISALTENGLWGYSTWLLNQCAAVIVPSRTIARVVRKNAKCRTTVIGNGVNLELFTPAPQSPAENRELRERFHLDPDKPVVLYVGRIDPDKQVDLVARATSIAFDSVDAQFLVIGDGHDREKVMDVCRSLGIFDQCRFPGYVSCREELAAVYRLASVFVTASEVEIQSSVVLEAASSGTPVVAFDASSMPELILNNKTGFLVAPLGVHWMARKIAYLLANPGVAQSMGHAAREFAKNHSLETSFKSHESQYRKLIERHPKAFSVQR